MLVCCGVALLWTVLPGAGIVPGGAAGIDAASAAARAAAVAQSLQSSLGFAGAAAGPAGVTNLRARIYVGSCPFEINDKQLRAIFEPFGAVKSCELLPATDATSGHAHRGYGFIEFEVRTVYQQSAREMACVYEATSPRCATAERMFRF